MSNLISIYRKYIPEPMKRIIYSILFFIPNVIHCIRNPRRKWDAKRNTLRRKCISYFKKYGTTEQRMLISFLKTNQFFDFPYEWTKKYNLQEITVLREDDFPYVIRNGKKLFGKKSFSNEEWKSVYNQILLEQDVESPHRYMTEMRMPDSDSIFADIGAAEGFLALDIIDKVKKLYIFEYNTDWTEALEKTFKPWKDKVEIIDKYVSDIDSDDSITLDTFFADKNIDFIKADIEGYEERMLQGGANVFKNKLKRCLLCCYHRNSAEEYFKSFLGNSGFDKIEVNNGFMIWTWAEEVLGEPLTPPFTRHGVLYAEKT